MKEQSKKGFLAKILENNREFDSTVAVFFVFTITFATIGSIIVAMMTGKQVPQGMFDVMNVFENFILMILSYFFHKSHSTGQWHGSDESRPGSDKSRLEEPDEMNNDLLRRLLIDEEGIDLKAHKVDGKWHVGIGHNLEIVQTDEELEILGDYEDPSEVSLIEEQAYALFDIDVADALDDVSLVFSEGELEGLGETRRAVIISMVFQMGGAGVRKFKNFIQAVKGGDFEVAANEMLYANVQAGRRSAWYKQTPERCQRAADAMRDGYFERYQSLDQVDTGPDSRDPDKSGLAKYTDQELIAELARRLGI